MSKDVSMYQFLPIKVKQRHAKKSWAQNESAWPNTGVILSNRTFSAVCLS